MKILKYNNFVLDFDGIFTDNKVYCDFNGNEFVRCCKYDSLALSIIKKYIRKNKFDLNFLILSSEENKVVTSRANKLKIQVYQGIENKFEFLKKFLFEKQKLNSFDELIYLGNDINDLECIKSSSFSACPKDSPPIIKENSDFIGMKNGGDGFIREVIEYLITPLKLDDIYKKNVIL